MSNSYPFTSGLNRWILPLCLFALAFFQFANTLGHDYAWDDEIVIGSNESVKAGLPGIPRLFLNVDSERLSDQYGYRPITLSSFALDISLFGSDRPGWGHFMSVLYFACLILVLFGTLRKLLPDSHPYFSFFICFLFIVHPVHVEVVANIKSRDETLALLFGLLALNTFLKSYQEEKVWPMLPAALFLLLGVLSKESAITFLAVLPFSLLFQSGDWKKKLKWSAVLPVFILIVGGGIWGLQTGLSVSETGATAGTGVFFEDPVLGNSLLQPRTHAQTAATIPVIMLRYLKNFIVPYPLSYYYGYNQLPLTDWGNWQVYLSLVLHIGLLILGILGWRKRWKGVGMGVGYYFITLSPYLHIVRILPDTMADRYLFAPSLGLCMVVVGLGAMLWTKLKVGEKWETVKKKPLFWGVGVVLLVLMGLTWSRNGVWKNNDSLFTNDISRQENCARCHYYHALALTDRYKEAAVQEKRELQVEIIHHLNRAIEITPLAYNAYMKLGEAYAVFGNEVMRASTYEQMTAQFPEQGLPWFYLGEAYWNQNNYAAAIRPLTRSSALAPNQEETWFLLGWSHFHTGDPQQAVNVFQSAVQRFPNRFRFYHAISDVFFEAGQSSDGFEWLLAGHAAAPNDPQTYQMLYLRYFNAGDLERANYYQQEGRNKGLIQ